MGTEGLRYLLVSGASLGWNLLVSYLFVDGLGLPAVPGVIAASVVVGFVWNYPLHRLFVFRQPETVLARPLSRAAVEVGEEPASFADGRKRR